MIRIALRVPDAWRGRARAALAEIALRWDVPAAFVDDAAQADVVYGAAAPAEAERAAGAPAAGDALAAGALVLPFDAALYDPATVCHASSAGGACVPWGRADRPPGADADLVGAVFRLLTLLDESQVDPSARDRRGIFRTDALPQARRDTLAEPLVERLAGELWRRLMARRPALERARVPRWPRGCRFAVAPSHDVDAIHLGSPVELATNLAKAVLRRDAVHLRLFALGARHAARPLDNPYYAFGTWRDWEARRGLRSAFYVFHRPEGTAPDVNDCKSSLARLPADWAALRALADEGWEFGLHPSIHCKDTPGAFAKAKLWLESRLERPVSGLRHHYWALDWRDPYATHRLHAAAGYRYDSSIAWRERAGFRAGTTLPYTPRDRSSGEAADLVELPCVLMDGHVLLADARGRRAGEPEALATGRAVVDRVREAGGVLTTNWHQETAFNRLHYARYLETLDALLLPFAGASDVWFATPREVAEHWRSRAAGLLRGAA